jgi:gas vesicle protein
MKGTIGSHEVTFCWSLQVELSRKRSVGIILGSNISLKKFKNKRKKGVFNMGEHEKTKVNFFKGLLIGGALGALAGILFAPKSGKKLRADIREKGNEILNDGKKIYADAGAKTKDILEEVKHQAKDLKKEAENTGEKIADEVHERIGLVKKVFGK